MISVDKNLCNQIPQEIRMKENIIPIGLDDSGALRVVSSSNEDRIQKIIASFFPGYLVKLETKDWKEIRKISYSNYGFLISDPASPKAFLLNLITDCASLGYSDLHIEPEADRVNVRALANGQMLFIISFDKKHWLSILAEIKLMSHMNLAETTLPQDAQISGFDFGDLRVSTHPTIFGENIVIRILDKSSQNYLLSDLGVEQQILKDILSILQANKGMFVICGSTNSGKSTTAHAILKHLNNGSRNIMTLENPVEHIISGIRQTSITKNFGFFEGLRSILRQNPGIIFIGEIRDEETAKLAAQAEMSGKMVIATLHAKSAEDVVERLKNLGIKSPQEHLSFILFQELIPVSCCSSFACPKCFGSGFQARKLAVKSLKC